MSPDPEILAEEARMAERALYCEPQETPDPLERCCGVLFFALVVLMWTLMVFWIIEKLTPYARAL